MKNPLISLLQGFDYASLGEFGHSMFPTVKYSMFSMLLIFTIPLSIVDKIFGLDYMAVAALFLIMILEIVSGVYASKIKKVPFSSARLSRFSFKMACYLILIAVPYLFYTSFHNHGDELASTVFNWLHSFLVIEIVVENLISVLENIAVIQGGEENKTHWITKIKTKIENLLL